MVCIIKLTDTYIYNLYVKRSISRNQYFFILLLLFLSKSLCKLKVNRKISYIAAASYAWESLLAFESQFSISLPSAQPNRAGALRSVIVERITTHC